MDDDDEPHPHPKRSNRGRPVGSDVFRRVARARERAAAEAELPQAAALAVRTSIEKARDALAEKRRQKQLVEQVQVFDIPKGSNHHLMQFGDLESMSTIQDDLQQKLVKSAMHAIRSDHQCSEQELASVQLNPEIQTMSFKTLASTTGDSNVNKKFLAIGQAFLETACFLWNLLFAMLVKVSNCTRFDGAFGHSDSSSSGSGDLQSVQPLLTCIRLRYDETPTKVRVDDPRVKQILGGGRSSQIVMHLDEESKSTSSLHAKILQTECFVGVLMQYRSQKTGETKYSFISGQVPTPLCALKSTTGANTAAALHRIMDRLPAVQELSRHSKFSVRHSCSDQAGANIKAERFLSDDFPHMSKLHTLCDVHKLYRVTRSSMTVIDFDISGLLSFALSMGEPGSVSTIHQSLVRIFMKKLVPWPLPLPRLMLLVCCLHC